MEEYVLLVQLNGVNLIKKDMFMQTFMISTILGMIFGLLVMEVYFILRMQEIVFTKSNTELQALIFGVLELDLKMEK